MNKMCKKTQRVWIRDVIQMHNQELICKLKKKAKYLKLSISYGLFPPQSAIKVTFLKKYIYKKVFGL